MAWIIPDPLPGVEVGMADTGGNSIQAVKKTRTPFPVSLQGTWSKSGHGGEELRPRVSAAGLLSAEGGTFKVSWYPQVEGYLRGVWLLSPPTMCGLRRVTDPPGPWFSSYKMRDLDKHGDFENFQP